MQRENLTKKVKELNVKTIIFLLLFSGLFLLTRVPRLQNDIVNPDGVNWHYRSQMFMNGLKYNTLELTYQHYHPGVTVMWITAPAIEIFRQFPGNDSYNMYNFIGFDFVAKYTLVIAQLFISFLIIFFLSKILNFQKALVIVSLFTFEPFLLGNSRLYHLDTVLTLLIFLTLILYYLAITKGSKLYLIFTAVALGLAFLTKTASLILLAFIICHFLFTSLVDKKFKKGILLSVMFLVVFCATIFILWPALWVRPLYFISLLFKEGYRVGITRGHEVIVLGDTLQDGGIFFYPLVILLKASPFALLGIVIYKFSKFKELLGKGIKSLDIKSFNFILIAFYLLYFVVMSIPSKKLDRYMLVEFPLLAYISFMGFLFLKQKLHNRLRIFWGILGLNIILFWIIPFIKLFPFYFTYTSPLFVNAQTANTYLGQKPFGVGMYDLKQFILNKYGYYPSLGFIDFKPMEAIYPNSKVHDIRVEPMGNYDLIVLGPNEDFSDNVLKNEEYDMIYDTSYYINGLEYWRIYVKRPK